MRKSDFDRLVADEFGASYGALLVQDLHLTSLGGRSAAQAMNDGVDPRDAWAALCDQQSVPEERRWGRDREPRRDGVADS